MSKPPIRWRRGFFRFWVLLAGIWLLIAVPIAINGLLNPYVDRKCVATRIGNQAPTLEETYSSDCTNWRLASAAGELVATDVARGFMLYTLPETAGPELAVRIEQARRVVEEYITAEQASSRLRTIMYFLIWGIGLPLGVLFAGWAVAWALSGFNGRSTVSKSDSTAQ